MNIETIIWLCFFILLIVGCLDSMMIRFYIVRLEEKIEELQEEIKEHNTEKNKTHCQT